ncbi:MAG: hypothetical protein WCA32_08480 [Chromatiaceae bacterium]
MIPSEFHDDAEEVPLWEVVPLADYRRPERPAAEVVRSGLFGLFRSKQRQNTDEAVVAEESLRKLPEDQLNSAAAWPDWQDTVPALEQAMPDLTGSDTGRHRIRVVVGAPYSGTREMVRCWAQLRQWLIVEPPGPERILAQDESWFDAISDDGPPLVIAELEHCMLRHPFGLAFLRRLLDRLRASPRRCLIATNSWTWAYLTAAMRIGDAMAAPVTLQALDADRLERWFSRLARPDGPATFRQADDGSLVLTRTEKAAVDSSSDARAPGKRSDFLRLLAGHSRGIAGVAWGIWRRSLQTPASDGAATRLTEGDTAAEGPVVWVRPWSHVDWPSLPADAGLPELLLLHALLIHGGLPEVALSEVLSALGVRGMVALQGLAAHGIVEEHHARWQVTPLGYPATREALASEGLIVDRL